MGIDHVLDAEGQPMNWPGRRPLVDLASLCERVRGGRHAAMP